MVERETGIAVVAFDAGGGRSSAELDASIAAGEFDRLRAEIQTNLPHVREIVLEPGQEIAEATEALCVPILEVRHRGSRTDVVLDAGLPDLPYASKVPHRIFLLQDGALRRLPEGSDRLLGRTCLEDDVLACVTLPEPLNASGRVIIADCGAYDASMQFAFAQGRISGNTAR